eukprot:CAMPEP_0177282930 /NCGR_PEP_ID=MMETSP0367-20130122/71729_1 /TAXON_ID=447022 ORGANISM="Scrippsiella hangoei-like, Strain SHHI-4" /NCGR_SAMPLE_ID=MMETSP0367 /ASSEMBLY_ACC=CAM_ASM_000362 /LENGTH=55 /DNA_ID=CAMNT_0018739897 /DNA_START=17 /DNA_END=181 /DNA_ORIENTATION=-
MPSPTNSRQRLLPPTTAMQGAEIRQSSCPIGLPHPLLQYSVVWTVCHQRVVVMQH